MHAVILVGGFGTRLRPLTLSTPKQMLPLVDRPMIEWVVAGLGAQGVTEVVLALGYRPDRFRQAYPEGTIAGVPVRYAVEPEPMDTAGAIGFAARAAGIDRTFVAVNGDVITDTPIADLLAVHRRRGAAGTIALTPVEDPSRYGVVVVDEDDRVRAFIEKPPPGEAPSNWINAGTYVLEPSVVDAIPPTGRTSIERVVFPAMVARGELYAVRSHAYWVDAGTPASYLQVATDLVAGRRPGWRLDAVHPSASVAADAHLDGSVVSARCRVGAGARLVASALLPGAVVGDGAEVVDSIVGPGAVVGAGSRLSNHSIVGEAAHVPPGAVLDAARLPDADTRT
jgi:mannose-1-phosphate guanylyltransferase